MTLRIKEVIKSKGLTIEEAANIIGISRSGLNQHIKGNPTVEVLERIATALNVDIRELFDKPTETELTALVEHQKDFYKAETLEELKDIVKQIEGKEV